jgi:hypothetical protein
MSPPAGIAVARRQPSADPTWDLVLSACRNRRMTTLRNTAVPVFRYIPAGHAQLRLRSVAAFHRKVMKRFTQLILFIFQIDLNQ